MLEEALCTNQPRPAPRPGVMNRVRNSNFRCRSSSNVDPEDKGTKLVARSGSLADCLGTAGGEPQVGSIPFWFRVDARESGARCLRRSEVAELGVWPPTGAGVAIDKGGFWSIPGESGV
jgi:hypothetical protein